MNPNVSALIKAIESDARADVESVVPLIEIGEVGLTPEQVRGIAEYIDSKSTAESIGWDTIARWHLAAHRYAGSNDALHKAAVAKSKMKDWSGAIEPYRRLDINNIDYSEQTTEWFANYGWCAHRAGEIDESRTAFRKMLRIGGDEFSGYLHDILDGDTDKFLQKVRTSIFLTDYKDEIDTEYEVSRAESSPARSELVFTYWAQGVDAAPPVVRASINSWKREIGAQLVVLTESELDYWIRFDTSMHDRLPARSARFSDVLRTELLAKYGGTWVDATTFPTESYKAFSQTTEGTNIFAPRYQGAAISSWYLKASSDGALIHRLNAALRVYWRHHKKAIGYFMFHFMFECIALGDFGAKREWSNSVNISSRDCHRVHAIMAKDVRQDEFERRLNAAPVQKMTYKIKDMVVVPDCGVSRIVRRAYGA